MKKRKEKKKIAEKREVWTSGQLDSVPSPTEGLRAPGLTTGPHMYIQHRNRKCDIYN